MRNIQQIKTKTQNAVLQKLSILPEVRSITFVGSFENSNDLSTVSDIDIIVIVDKLTENSFKKIEQVAKSITGNECGLPDYQVKLNMSFGPLKFNDEKTIVFHLMVYDIEGHRKHVIESPFTCCDWQYQKSIYGNNLSEIYPSNALQLNDIIGTRRGLVSYLTDLKEGVISYRNYVFHNDIVFEQKQTYQMDNRHKKEYSYHIMKFLMLNLLKITHQQNLKYTDIVLTECFRTMNIFSNADLNFFLKLSRWKYEHSTEPERIPDRLKSFIENLNLWLINFQQSLPKITFIRHAKTVLNDGSFLGIRRNPEIVSVPAENIPLQEFDVIYTGTLQRTISTGKLLKGDQRIQTELLNEIDYGLAEGMTLEVLQKKFPDIIEAWAKKEDPKFPEGENQKNVEERLTKFINEVLPKLQVQNIAVVTHNVVIRTLLAKFYQTSLTDCYRFVPDHMEQISFRIFKDVIIPELTKEQRIKFRDQVLQWV